MLWSSLYAYTLKDALKSILTFKPGSSPTYALVCTNFADLCTSLPTTDRIEELWQLILFRYHSEIVAISDTEATNPISQGLVDEWWQRFQYVLRTTCQKYSTLIDIYLTNLSTLMSKLTDGTVESGNGSTNATHTGQGSSIGSTQSRFNDTPQNSGDFATDTYATNVTNGTESGTNTQTDTDATTSADSRTSTRTFDPTTTMNRISEIQDKMRKTYDDWVSEFEKTFIEGANYED